ncbi:GNAT family N-acetyltransferase [Solicola sp. PLA-1-18]|uniref:GNAT family N-acetyltransferase n=1 Tax=Solicola sp. PLA-1-18 TaxID=3380532 RepID=UPI003B7E8FB2
MTDDLRIRRAAETDDGQLAAIAYDTWSFETAVGPLPDAAAPFFDERPGVTVATTLVAFLPEAVAGYVAISPGPDTSQSWTIHDIAVAPLLQGRGIGLALVRAAVAAAHSAGATEVGAQVPAGETAVGRLLLRTRFHTLTQSTRTGAGTSSGRTVMMMRSPLHRST